MKLTAFITFRYVRGKSKFISMSAILSFAGVFIGTGLLVAVLSIFNGFQAQIRNSIFKFDPHITVEKQSPPNIIDNPDAWISRLKKDLADEINSAEPMIQSPAIVKRNNNIDHIFLRGLHFPWDAKERSYAIPETFPPVVKDDKKRSIPAGNFCLVGKEMGLNMDLRIGDTIDVIVPRGQFAARVGMQPRLRSYKVAGYFRTGHYQYDSRVVVIAFEEAKKLYDIGNGTQQIVINVKNLNRLDKVRFLVNRIFPMPYYVHTVEDDQRNFFAALKLEKTIMTIIVFLFILAAMVGIVVATQHTVRSKRRDIGILKAIGMSDRSIGTIFTLNGFIMGVLGSVFGIIFGVILSLNLERIVLLVQGTINIVGRWYTRVFTNDFWLDKQLIPRDVYYFDHIPISIESDFIITIAVASICLAALASFIPAWIASRMDPMEIIRRGDV